MAPKFKKKSGRAGWFLCILFLALLVYFSTGKIGFWQQGKIKYKKAVMEHDLKGLEAEIDSLELEIEALNDTTTIEKIAREKYGMGKKNEKVYHVESEANKNVE